MLSQSTEVRQQRRRTKERQARASSVVEHAVTTVLRAQGHTFDELPVPTHPPAWRDDVERR